MIPFLRYESITVWPGDLRHPDERTPAQFKASWAQTLNLLGDELFHLGAHECTIALALDPKWINRDGSLHRGAPKPDHPGVILSFPSAHFGVLRYSTDVFTAPALRTTEGWRMNVRAIALGLVDLRRLDRYGIAQRGEQYTGFKEIGSGIALGPQLTLEEACAFVAKWATQGAYPVEPDELFNEDILKAAFRVGSRLTHPDAGGNMVDFQKLSRSRDVIAEHIDKQEAQSA